MKTIELKLYKFDELSDEAKEKAISEYRENNVEYFWVEEWKDSLRKFTDYFGIETDWSVGTSSCSYCDMSRNNFDGEILELSGIRLRTYLLNNYYDIFYERKSYGQYKKRENGKWKYDRYSKIQYIETSCPFTGYCGDEDVISPMRNFIEKPSDNITFQELIGDCLTSWKDGLLADMEYQDSEEFAKEELDQRDYDFTEDGEIY